MATTSRRSLLTAALAAPVAAVGVPLAAAAPAAAADPRTGCQTVVDWTDIVTDVTAEPGSPLQARIIRLAGTEFLQLRGTALHVFTGDTPLGVLPQALRPSRVTRGIAARNNHEGVNAIRVEVSAAGVLTALGTATAPGEPPTTNIVRWVQLDSFSSVLR
ncbi:hypothetical protein [Streptomyces sp. NPDC059247]|uniref:hypothetical protein n=1 Tax=Streptomyces sp. NPDC059247 TaxID=3346790 RepID=UPI00368DD6F8